MQPQANSSKVKDGHHIPRQKLRSQTKNMIMNIREYIAQQGRCLSVTEIDEETARAVGVCVRTVRAVKQQASKCHPHPITSPPQRATPSCIFKRLDEFDKQAIRKEILSFYDRGELPTLDKLLKKVKQDPLNFRGSRTILWTVIRELGFRFKKFSSGSRILMERHDIVSARNKYLRLIEKNRKSDNPRPEVYLDETWVNQRDSVDRCWTVGDGTVGPKVKSGKGARFIILHAGGINGFIPGALLMFKLKNGSKGDYHDSMNHETFLEWFEKQLLPNIPERSLIIMDNAAYHSKLINKVQTSSNRKCEIINWLLDNKIEHDPSITKSELIDICKLHIDKQKYLIDEIAVANGHEVLRLPPYHCELNPIELIWAKIKTEVKKENSNELQYVKRVAEVTRNAIERVSDMDWKKCIEHTIKVEDSHRRNDMAREHLIEKLVVRLESDDSDSNDSI